MSIIETKGITKKFGALEAVSNVSIEVKEGEIFGLLGPNGAGKTTLISMLTTMKKPTSGEARVNSFDIKTQPDLVRRSIGIVFQDPSLDEELTAYENLDLHAAMYGIPRDKRKWKIEEVIEVVELKDRLYDTVKTFSGGMRRRLEIARGLLHAPQVLFLDEPTIGLDPQTRNHIWEYIVKLKKENRTTIILTTHYMDEADAICDKIAIIDHGKIVTSGTSSELKNSLGGDVIVVETKEGHKLKEKLETLQLNWIKNIQVIDGKVNIQVEFGEKRIPKLFEIANKDKIEITSVNLHKPTLDDVFLHYTGKSIREENGSVVESMRMRRKAWGRGK